MIEPDDEVFLREDVRAEPLVNGFRAHGHLIAPHTFARNVVARHLPRLHEALGDPDRADDIHDLIRAIEDERPTLVEIGHSIEALDSLMLARGTGSGLESLYGLVPEPLRGYVELLYNRYNGPTVRFLEAALYASPGYDPTLQGICLERINPDLPGDGLAVPRLPQAGRIIRRVPFRSEVWDFLGRARRSPVRAADIAATLDTDFEDVRPFLSEHPPGSVASGSRSPVTFLNHACVLFESPSTSVLADPLIAHRPHGTHDRFSFADLPERLHYLIITHAHLDHLDIETLLQIRHLTGTAVVPRVGAGELIDPSLKLILKAIGFHDVVELDDIEDLPIPGGRITALPFFGEHSDLFIRGKCGYGLVSDGQCYVLTADSQCLEPRVYRTVRELLGPVAALFVGMECEGSAMTTSHEPYLPRALYTREMSESRRSKASNAKEGLWLLGELKPACVYIYAMGLEPWLSYMFGVADKTRTYSMTQAETLIAECARAGIPARLLRGYQPLNPCASNAAATAPLPRSEMAPDARPT